MTSIEELALRNLWGRYDTDPEGYARDVLGFSPTPQQIAIADALRKPPYKVLVPSANGVGKTASAGWLVNWHHDSYDPGIVLATSSTMRQVQRQLFKEVRKLRPFQLGFAPKAPFIFHRDNHTVLGFSTNKADAFQGHHEAAFFLVMDEATGVDGEFWERADTMFKGQEGQGWVCFFNPNDTTTPAYAAEQGGEWHTIRLSAIDHPNILAELQGKPAPIPAAIRLSRVKRRMLRECDYAGRNQPDEPNAFLWPSEEHRVWLSEPKQFGEDDPPWGWWVPRSALFEVQILGRWPSKAMQAVWGPTEFDKCIRSVEVKPEWPVQIGADMARGGGAKIVIAVRKGLALMHLEELPSSTKSPEVAERLRLRCHEFCPLGVNPKTIPVVIDDTGGYGSGVCDYPNGYRFIGLKASQASRTPDKYPNVRSELWWAHKIAAEEGGFVVGNIRRGAELLNDLRADYAAARYTLDSKTRRVIEGKAAMAERLRRSPDYADAVNMAWWPC